jgi:hypothetical protein
MRAITPYGHFPPVAESPFGSSMIGVRVPSYPIERGARGSGGFARRAPSPIAT